MIFPLFGGCWGGGGGDVDVYDDGDADENYDGTETVSDHFRVKLCQTWMQRRRLTVNASCHCHDWKTLNSPSIVFVMHTNDATSIAAGHRAVQLLRRRPSLLHSQQCLYPLLMPLNLYCGHILIFLILMKGFAYLFCVEFHLFVG